jgi:hypothetical protein
MIVLRQKMVLSCCLLLLACASQQEPKPAEAPQASPEPEAAVTDAAPAAAAAAPAPQPSVAAAPAAPAPQPSVATGQPKAPLAPPIVNAKAPSAAAAGDTAGATVNARGVSLAACQTVCAHILNLSLQALPEDTTSEVRKKHENAVVEMCPSGCMREATSTSNACVLQATTVDQAVACQP